MSQVSNCLLDIANYHDPTYTEIGESNVDLSLGLVAGKFDTDLLLGLALATYLHNQILLVERVDVTKNTLEVRQERREKNAT